MAECQELELEIPENNDDGVVEAMKFLNRQLRTDLMKNYLKVAGDFLYIATNATAKDAEQQIKVQSCLFDAVKLCDAWNLMLTSFKVGASDILEKLHIAYLKLLDGFPDFALADVESVTKHVSSMKAACKKAEGSFKTVTRELEDTIGFLKDEEKKNRTIRDNCLSDYGKKEDALKKRIIEQMQRVDLTVFAEDASLKILELELEGPVDNFHSVSKKIENCVLAKAALLLALPKLKDALEFLVKIEQLVDKWYNECKEVVEKNMKANVKQAGKLSEAKQKEYWKPLVFVKTAYDFLCRWKALQQICLSTSTHMRRVRGDIDWYYTENLYPAEAVEKAWDMREKNEELKKNVEPRKRDMVVAEGNQIQSLRSFQMLLGMGGTQHKDDLYRYGDCRQFETICCFLWVLDNLLKEPEIKNTRGDAREVCGTLWEVTVKVQDQSIKELVDGYVTSKRRLRGIPVGAKEVETKKIGTEGGSKKEHTSTEQIFESIKRLTSNGSNLTSTMSRIEGYVQRGEEQLAKDIKDEEEATSTDVGASEGFIKGFKSAFNSTYDKYVSPNKKKSDSVADSIKMHKFSIDIIENVVEKLKLDKLPLKAINDVYSGVLKRLTELSTQMKIQLEMVDDGKLPVPRDQEWQDGAFCILVGFVELFSASRLQLQKVQGMSVKGKINEQSITGITWKMVKEMVVPDPSLYQKAGEIDKEVSNQVADLRRKEKEDHERRIRERKAKELEIKRAREEEERKRKEREEENRKQKEREEEEKRKQKEREEEEERKQKEREEEEERKQKEREEKRKRKEREEEEEKRQAEEEEEKRKRKEMDREERAQKDGYEQEMIKLEKTQDKREIEEDEDEENKRMNTGKEQKEKGEEEEEKGRKRKKEEERAQKDDGHEQTQNKREIEEDEGEENKRMNTGKEQKEKGEEEEKGRKREKEEERAQKDDGREQTQNKREIEEDEDEENKRMNTGKEQKEKGEEEEEKGRKREKEEERAQKDDGHEQTQNKREIEEDEGEENKRNNTGEEQKEKGEEEEKGRKREKEEERAQKDDGHEQEMIELEKTQDKRENERDEDERKNTGEVKRKQNEMVEKEQEIRQTKREEEKRKQMEREKEEREQKDRDVRREMIKIGGTQKMVELFENKPDKRENKDVEDEKNERKNREGCSEAPSSHEGSGLSGASSSRGGSRFSGASLSHGGRDFSGSTSSHGGSRFSGPTSRRGGSGFSGASSSHGGSGFSGALSNHGKSGFSGGSSTNSSLQAGNIGTSLGGRDQSERQMDKRTNDLREATGNMKPTNVVRSPSTPNSEGMKDGESRDSLGRQNSSPYVGGCTHTREDVRGNKEKDEGDRDGKPAAPEITKRDPAPY